MADLIVRERIFIRLAPLPTVPATANSQIAYVGHDHVDHSTVSDAIAGKTLFIHGSSVDEGNIASIKATKPGKKKHNKTSKHHKTIETSRTRQRHRRQRRLQKWRDDQRWKTEAKWQGDADNDVEPRFVSSDLHGSFVRSRNLVVGDAWTPVAFASALARWRCRCSYACSLCIDASVLINQCFFSHLRLLPVHLVRWRSEQKWKGNNDNNENSNDSADLPKWKQTKKWKSNV